MHGSFRHYIKFLVTDMAFILHHIGKINDIAMGEFDDQLHLKVKNMKEELLKKKRKNHNRMKSLFNEAHESNANKEIGIVMHMNDFNDK
jgi:hypothetical protein